MDFQIQLTLSEIFMITGFLLSMYSCISNDIIQTLGTYLTANKNTPFWYMWIFVSAVAVLTIGLGWYFNGGDISFGRLDRIPQAETCTIVHVLAPIAVLIITKLGMPVATAFVILTVFSMNDISVIYMMLTKSALGYMIAFICGIIVYSIIARPIERFFYYTQKRSGNKHVSKWWLVAKWCSTAFIWSQWLMQDSANFFVYMPRKVSFETLVFLLTCLVLLLGYITYTRGGKIQNIVKMKTNVQDPRSATILDIIYACLLLYFIKLNNIPMSTTWVFIGLLAGREFALYHRLRFESPKKMYKHILKDLYKVVMGLVISIIVVLLLTQFSAVKNFFFAHFIGG